MSAQEFDKKYVVDVEENEADDLMAMFMNATLTPPEANQAEEKKPEDAHITLFDNDYLYAKAALRFINKDKKRIAVEFNDVSQIIRLTAPDDLKQKFKSFPPEIYPENGDFILTADKKAYMEEVKRARGDESDWPKQHYLWRKHPLTDWLQERMLGNTGRHEALVMGIDSELNQDEAIFLVSALIPNRKAHPVIWEWYAVHTAKGKVAYIKPLQEVLLEFGDKLKTLPNTGLPVNTEQLEALRAPVIDAVESSVLQKKQAFDAEMQPKLKQQLAELTKLKSKQVQQMELDIGKGLETTRESKRITKQRQIDKVFAEYQQWVKDTWQTEPAPYIQLVAVIASVNSQDVV